MSSAEPSVPVTRCGRNSDFFFFVGDLSLLYLPPAGVWKFPRNPAGRFIRVLVDGGNNVLPRDGPPRIE